MHIKQFVFNFVAVNTYLLYDGTHEALLIDPGFYKEREVAEFEEFMRTNNLVLKKCVITHPHPDHYAGGKFVVDAFDVVPEMHPAAKSLFSMSEELSFALGFRKFQPFDVNYSLNEGADVKFGNSQLSVSYTPGHADGSVCLYNAVEKCVFCGDVLFKDSIGRTDLPTGNFDTIISSVEQKLFTLNEDVEVYSGHGESFSIGYAKKFNPYF